MPTAGCTALQGLRDQARLEAGQRILIHGAGGGVGTFAGQIARGVGAHGTAVTRTQNVELGRPIGAGLGGGSPREDFTRGGQRYDIVFDIGADRSTRDLQRALQPNGKLLLVGAPGKVGALVTRLLGALVLPGNRRLVSARARQEDLVALSELVDAGKPARGMDGVHPLDAAPEASRYFGTGRVGGRVVIRIG